MNDINNIHCILENIIKNSTDQKLIEIAKQWNKLIESNIDVLPKHDCLSFFDSNWESEILAKQGISI